MCIFLIPFMRATCLDILALLYLGTLIIGKFYKIQISIIHIFLTFTLLPMSYILHCILKRLLTF